MICNSTDGNLATLNRYMAEQDKQEALEHALDVATDELEEVLLSGGSFHIDSIKYNFGDVRSLVLESDELESAISTINVTTNDADLLTFAKGIQSIMRKIARELASDSADDYLKEQIEQEEAA